MVRRRWTAVLSVIAVVAATFTLAPPPSAASGGTASISGTVTGPGGEPLEGVEVFAAPVGHAPHDESSGGNGAFVTLTDADGDYTLDGLHAGHQIVEFDPIAHPLLVGEFYDDADHRSAATPVMAPDGGEATGIDAQLGAAGAIAGTITNEGGDPLAGVHVYADNVTCCSSSSAVTDASGDYVVGGLVPGTHRIEFDPSDLVDPHRGEFYDDAATWQDATGVDVTLGATTGGIDAVLADYDPSRIAGTVTGPGGLPAEDVTVILQPSYSYPDPVPVSGSDADGGSTTVPTSGSSGPGDRRVHPFRDEHGELRSDVADPSAGPPFATDEADVDDAATPTDDSGQVAEVQAVTGADGTYLIDDVPDGVYTLSFQPQPPLLWEYYDDTNDFGEAMEFEVSGGNDFVDIDAELDIGGTVTGTVVDDDGDPVEGAYLDVATPGGSYIGFSTSGVDGSWSVGALPAGDVIVYAQAYGQPLLPEWYDDAADMESATPIPVEAGETTSGIEIDLVGYTPGSISGTVTGPDGSPLADAYVGAYGDVSGDSTTTDANGDYTVTGLAPGDHEVYFEATGLGYEYYDDTTDYDERTMVAVTDGADTPGIDAQLDIRLGLAQPCSVLDGTCTYVTSCIEGEVTATNEITVAWKPVCGGTDVTWSSSVGHGTTGAVATLTFDGPGPWWIDACNDFGSSVYCTRIWVQLDLVAPLPGSISGTVTGPDGSPLPGAQVTTFDDYGFASTTTAADGSYQLDGLSAGDHVVQFSGGPGLGFEYYDDADDYGDAEPVPVTEGADTPDIDAMLDLLPITEHLCDLLPGLCQVTSGCVEGQVSDTRELTVAFAPGCGTDVAWETSDGQAAAGPIAVFAFADTGPYWVEGCGTTGSSLACGRVWFDFDSGYTMPAATATYGDGGPTSSFVEPGSGEVAVAIPSGSTHDLVVTTMASCPGDADPDLVELLLDGDPTVMTEDPPSSGTFVATIDAGDLTDGPLERRVTCPGPDTSTATIGEIVLYDPSGDLTDALSGEPVPGAVVRLHRVPGWQARIDTDDTAPDTCQSNASKLGGAGSEPWNQPAPTHLGVPVNPDVTLVDPAVNPFVSDADGHYGWDVPAGCWYVTVAAPGYFPLVSPVVGVPTAVTDLDLALMPHDAPTFSDVGSDHQFFGDIAWVAYHGIAQGRPDGSFGATGTMTRGAMAAVLANAAAEDESAGSGAAPCATAPFPDVPTGHPFCAEIAWAAANGFVAGYADGMFRPAEPVTRQTIAAMLVELAGGAAGPDCAEALFSDVAADHVFCPAIQWLVDHHVATGYADGTYRPTAPVTRQTAAAFLHRTMSLT